MGVLTNNRTMAMTLIATPTQSIMLSLALVPVAISLLGSITKSMMDKTSSHGTSYQSLTLSSVFHIIQDKGIN